MADTQALHESLSALADGRATAADWARVKSAWAQDPALRERWALWHAAGDGLRSPELAALHRAPEALLDALHARMPAVVVEHPRRRDWLAPLAVAAGFVALALGLGSLRPTGMPEPVAAAAPFTTPRAEALAGLSFAQAAAGRTLSLGAVAQESGLPLQPSPEIIDWALTLPDPAASEARP